MIYRLAMPDQIDDVQELRVLEWHGAPGHVFAAGDMIVELETHKVVIEVRAEHQVIMRQILVEDGGWAKLDAPIALLSDAADEPLPEAGADLAACSVTLAVA